MISSKYMITTLKYRPSIDGMRAIAVLSVIIYHLNKNLLPGGFIGVDIFFVISGYLISSIILSDIASGRFSFIRFYQRRISRIYPVFFFVSFAVIITAAFIYTPQDYASAGAVVTAAAMSLTNIKYMFQGNYFEISQDAQPLLHYWSLAVEEQFYFVLPLLLFIIFRIRVFRRNLILILFLFAVISFGICYFLTKINPTWAFFSLPTRAWELLSGSLLAVYHLFGRKYESSYAEKILSTIGFVLIIISLIIVSENNMFPGYIAALPVLGTVLLIISSDNTNLLSEKLLSRPIPVFVGKISYSLYLWHWPIYCFVDYSLFSCSIYIRTIAKIILVVVLSLTSYMIIEKPLRSYFNKKRALSYAFFTVSVFAIITMGVYIRSNFYLSPDLKSIKNGGIIINKSISKPVILLIGDSNGTMYGKIMKEIAKDNQYKLHVLCVNALDPLPGSKLFEETIKVVKSEKPDITVFAASWSDKIGNRREKLEVALNNILEKSKHVIIITQPPILPPSATREAIRQTGECVFFEEKKISMIRKNVNEIIFTQRSKQVHIVNIESLFQKKNGEIVFIDNSGKQMYHDKNHLSGFGANKVKELLNNEISRIISKDIL